MPGLLISHRFNAQHGAAFAAAAKHTGVDLELLVLPPDPEARIADADAARADVAYFSSDIIPHHAKQFFSATRKAPALQWMQVFNAGVDHPVFASVLERGVRLTTASGTAAEPIAQTAIAGMLMLARNFPRWLTGQRERRWDPMPPADFPRDLRGQTMLIYGLGPIGVEVARLARLLGLKTVGVRRQNVPVEHIDEMHTQDKLPELLPRCDWLTVACPLTSETRGKFNAALLARLPRGARFINISRGEVVDEPALIAALESGHLGGAYLDVFMQEPLPATSPLWDLPNVIITPHNSVASAGNDMRINALFLDNLKRWQAQQPLINEVKKS
ncbi:MAG: D-2-hydroxyacid dehydrogenase [Betaproteobacteria bacterium]